MSSRNRLRDAARLSALVAVLCLALISCATPAIVDLPDGFARYGEARLFTAASPEGVTLRVRTARNEPAQDLNFWADAMRIHLERNGYAPIADGEFSSTIGPGRSFEWIAPVSAEDWIYLTAIVVAEGEIVIIEAAGAYEQFDARREAVYEALATVVLQ